MAEVIEEFNDAANILELNDSEVSGGALKTSIPFLNSRTRHDNIVPSGAINNYSYLTDKKGANKNARVQFSSDATVYTNQDGAELSVGSYEFDGINDYIESDTQLVSSYPFSINSWFKTSASNGAIMILSDKSSTIVYYGIYISGDNKLTQTAYNGVSSVFTKSDQDVNDGEWHMATAVFASATDRELYVDGQLVKTDTTNISYASGVDRWSIGRFGDNTPSSYIDGSISKSEVYARALDALEIWDLYAFSKELSQTSLTAKWLFNGDANDSSGNGNDGTVSGAINSTSWEEVPQLGYSLISDSETQLSSFDGINDYIAVNSDASLNFGSSNFSLSVWIKTKSSSGVWIGKRNLSSNNEGYILYTSSNKARFLTTGAGGVNVFVTGTTDINDGEWHHVVGVRLGNNHYIYVDGVLEGTQVSGAQNVSNSADFIFASQSTLANFWGGEACNASVYNAALSSADISSEYNAGYPTATANLVSYWPLAGDYLDKAGLNHLSNNGSIFIKDVYRPQPELPSLQVIDLSSLSLSNDIYPMHLLSSRNSLTSYELDEFRIDYTPFVSGARRILLTRVS